MDVRLSWYGTSTFEHWVRVWCFWTLTSTACPRCARFRAQHTGGKHLVERHVWLLDGNQ
jgi:hypothetical protein